MRQFETNFRPTRPEVLIGAAAALLLIGSAVVISRTADETPITTPPPAQSDRSSTPNHSQTNMVIHKNIVATVFWVGEEASEENDYIQNRSSTWQDDWQSNFGGVDSPDDRCGYNPCSFAPLENPFYFALPFSDYQENGMPKPASVLTKIPWYTGQPPEGVSLVKNRWVKITSDDKTVYGQWEDAGPFGEDDVDYVFGIARPQESRAGIDLSPATASYLNIDGRGVVTWQFVDEGQVPGGPWKEVITVSGVQH